jgi:menaquinone-dependent protoporphyrinogen oxidase
MSNLLIVFATREGQTAKIAQALQAQLRANGHAVDAMNAATATPRPDPYDAVIVAASVHAGSYEREIVSWVKTHAAALNARTSVFVSVCLSVLQTDAKTRRDVQAIVDGFLRTTGWRPCETKMVAGALKYTRYGFLKRWLMKWIAGKAGGDTDTSRDYEYTDWADLERFAAHLSEGLGSPAPVQSHA